MKVCLDSRLIQPGDYFVPVKGENFDGHKFIEAAVSLGAAGVIEVDELYKIASEKLSRINPKIIAITGSVGKSTMRSFLTTFLSQKYNVCEGSLNTKLGLAVNIVNDMKDTCQVFIAETGMDYMGELLETGEFLHPDIAVITNISESHYEKLGSLPSIQKAKSQILETVKDGGVGFLCETDSNILELETLGMIPGHINIHWYSALRFNSDLMKKAEFSFLGKHNIVNAIGAASISLELGLSETEILEGFKMLDTPKGRLKKIDGVNGSVLIDDTYNSSPVSCLSAIESVEEYFKDMKSESRKIAVLGGMLELGEYEDEGHRLIGQALISNRFDIVVLVGSPGNKIGELADLEAKGMKVFHAENSFEAGEIVKELVKPQKGDIILLKGSQGVRLEITVESLMLNPEDAVNLLVRQDARWKS